MLKPPKNYREVVDGLGGEDLVPPNADVCFNCQHLGKHQPYTCERPNGPVFWNWQMADEHVCGGHKKEEE